MDPGFQLRQVQGLHHISICCHGKRIVHITAICRINNHGHIVARVQIKSPVHLKMLHYTKSILLNLTRKTTIDYQLDNSEV